MLSQIDTHTLQLFAGFLLVLGRIGGVVAFTPVPGFRNVPLSVKLALTLLLACSLFELSAPWGKGTSVATLLPALAIESSVGICYGLATSLLFEGFQLGAQIVGLQAGFSYASTLDPNSQADSTVLSVLVFLATGSLFFATDLHHTVIGALAESLVRNPPGNLSLNPLSIPVVAQLGSDLFRVGLRLAAPVSAIMLTIDLGLALFSRMQAQLQVTTLGFSVKILIALVAFSTVIYGMGHLVRDSAKAWGSALRMFAQ